MGDLIIKRVEPGWLYRSIQESRAWAAKPKNKRWLEQVRANLKDQHHG